MTVPAALLSSVKNDWRTPPQYIEAVREVLGEIDLDPASSYEANKTVKAFNYYTEATDGLSQPWYGRVFLNPPYGYTTRDGATRSSTAVWTDRLYRNWSVRKVDEAILLVNASTDASWFQPLWLFPICFTDHRIQFLGGGKQPTKGNAFVYMPGLQSVHHFKTVFSKFGHVVLP